MYNTANTSITGNTFTGADRYGIGLFGQNGTPANANLTIASNTFTNNAGGIEIDSDTSGAAYSGTLTLTSNQFNGAGLSIYNDSATPVDATNNTFNGVLASTATTAQQFVIVDTIVDGVDVSGAGLVRTKTGEVFVTTNSFNNTTFFAVPTTVPSIQRGIDVSDVNDTIRVQGGAYAEAVNVNKTVTVDLTGNVTINSLAGIAASTVQLNANNLLTGDGSNTDYAGAVNGVGGSLTKQGSGTFTLSGTDGYSGATLISGGALSITGSIASSAVTVGNTGTPEKHRLDRGCRGEQRQRRVAPGTSPGTLSTGSVAFTGGSSFTAEVNGNAPGTHDELDVTGTVDLGGATLNCSGTITSSAGQVIVLIANDGGEAVTGTFAGLPEGAAVTINGVNFAISYVGGSGNDVVLYEADTNIHLDGSGNLVIDDVATASDDHLTIQSDTANNRYIVTDPGLALYTIISGASGSGTHTVFVPFGAVTGTDVDVNTGGGNRFADRESLPRAISARNGQLLTRAHRPKSAIRSRSRAGAPSRAWRIRSSMPRPGQLRSPATTRSTTPASNR